MGEKVNDTLFGELMTYTSQIMREGEKVASASNFLDTYFQDRGLSKNQAQAKAQQAIGLIVNSSLGTSKEDLFSQLQNTLKVNIDPGYNKARRELIKMVQAKDVSWEEMNQVLAEAGMDRMNHNGMDDLVMAGLEGKDIAQHLELLPPEASAYVFAKLNDWRATLDGIRAAVAEKNQGTVGITEPKMLREPIKDALKSIDKILDSEAMLNEAVGQISQMTRVAPDGFFDNLVSGLSRVKAPAPGAQPKDNPLPDNGIFGIFGDYMGKLGGNTVEELLNKPAQLARRDPKFAEAFSLLSMVSPKAQHAATEALKPFISRIENGKVVTDESMAKEFQKIIGTPKLRNAIDQWLWACQQAGKRDGAKLLDDKHPEVAKALAGLTPAERNSVQDIMNKIAMVNASKNQNTLSVMRDISTNLGARIVLIGTKGKMADALAVSNAVFDAANADFSNPMEAQKAMAQLQMAQQKMPIETFSV
jgi:hypothetical protein